MKIKNHQSGFTLLELMTAVAVAGILFAIAIPSYQNMVRNNCMTTKANSLISSLQLAKSEAVKRRAEINISATNAASGTNKWGTGWTVWQDINDDGDFNTNQSETDNEVIRVVQLSCDITNLDNNVTMYTYNSQGFINSSAGTFTICDDRTGETGRQITLSTTGRPNTNSEFVCP